jgi:hypothetical protein
MTTATDDLFGDGRLAFQGVKRDHRAFQGQGGEPVGDRRDFV